jgi:hypothetical protein
MKAAAFGIGILGLGLAGWWSAFAQPGGPPRTGFDAALLQLFGEHKAFSAQGELRVLDSQQKEKVVLPMEFAMREGKFRTEVDLTRMRGTQANPDQMAMLKQMGMDRIVSITRTDTGALHLLFPSARAAVRLEMPPEDRAAVEKPPAIERKSLGEETVEGHRCVKEQVTLTAANGRKMEVTVWTATDLKGFPIQVQTTEKGDTVTFRYRNVKFTAPRCRALRTALRLHRLHQHGGLHDGHDAEADAGGEETLGLSDPG